MFVYKVTNSVNGKVYIGKWAGLSVESRWRKHLRAAMQGSPYRFHCAIRKYGFNAFVLEIIANAASHEELNQLEIFWITKLRANDPNFGYNMTIGGDGVSMKRSMETRQKIREARIGQKHPVDVCEQIRESLKGKTLSQEHKRNIGLSLRGKKCPNRASFKGRRHSIVTKRLMSERQKQRLLAKRLSVSKV